MRSFDADILKVGLIVSSQLSSFRFTYGSSSGMMNISFYT